MLRDSLGFLISNSRPIFCIFILKPILFYLLIILFDGSGDINFSYCFVFTFVFRLFFAFLASKTPKTKTDSTEKLYLNFSTPPVAVKTDFHSIYIIY